jgi:uncharacterized cupin superfamily protein
MTRKRSSINADGVFEPFSVDDVPWEDYSHGERFGARIRQLGEFGGCSQVGVCMEERAPGKQAYPAHYHIDVIVYTDSGRVGVRLTGEGYRKAATMEYWEGESA